MNQMIFDLCPFLPVVDNYCFSLIVNKLFHALTKGMFLQIFFPNF